MPCTTLGGDMQGGVHFFEGRLEQIGKGDDHTVIQAPYKIMRLRTVPDADYGEHQQVGNCSRQNTAEVLAPVPGGPFAKSLHRLGQRERVEQIITHPCTEGDMPAPPEISQRGGKIRLAEVGHHLNAEQLRDTQHHVDAAGKIRILLQRIEQDRQQCHRPGEGGIVPVKDRGNRRRSQVGNGILFHRTEQDHKEGTLGALPLPRMRGGQLGLHCSVPVDGALDQLREK